MKTFTATDNFGSGLCIDEINPGPREGCEKKKCLA